MATVNLKSYLSAFLLALSAVGLASCDDEDTYAELRKTERAQIANFLEKGACVVDEESGDTLLNVPGPINVISEAQFFENDSTTSVANNEYVLLSGSGVYMQIVRKGGGKLLENDESATVVCRYTEFNIAGDSIQSSNDNTATTENYQQLMNVSKSYGTITATFDSKGMMGQLYGTKVPSAWIFPLQFVNLGRYDGNDIALVRIIAPSTEGQDDAYSNVYPCFYEITYMRGDR